jgi:hypothetical protein
MCLQAAFREQRQSVQIAEGIEGRLRPNDSRASRVGGFCEPQGLAGFKPVAQTGI